MPIKSQNKIVVKQINDSPSEIASVIKLAQDNSKTLGFLPKGAFESYASRGQIIGAFDNTNKFVGYLLYALNLKGSFAYIVHLCVDDKWRRQGIAYKLFDELIKRTKNDLKGIRVRCRRDYEATKVWQKLGFAPRHEIAGRSKQGSILTIWWYDHGLPSLFNLIHDHESESKVQVVIDANIFFEIQEPDSAKNIESKALLNDWLQENIELCLTEEIFTEINRHDLPKVRTKSRSFVSTFKMVSCTRQIFDAILKRLYEILSKPRSERDESDCRQLAWAICSNSPFFITRDKRLLKKADRIYEVFGTQIWPPSLLIINQDSISRDADYQPARLTGSYLTTQRLIPDKIKFVEQLYCYSQKETKAKFRGRLYSCLADPQTIDTKIIISKENLLGLFALDWRESNVLKIPIFRLSNNKLSPTLARHLLHNAIIKASRETRVLTIIDDPHISETVIDSLCDIGFVHKDGIWIKISLKSVDTTDNLTNLLLSLCHDFSNFSYHFQGLSNAIKKAAIDQNNKELLRLEKILWPAKFTDLILDAFVIPIKPQWALHLFDPKLANQDLFGSEPALIFNVENAYYRSKVPRFPTAPARILWYVSKGGTNFHSTMAIRACSYSTEVIVDKPKIIYSRFRRLGIYKWKNVFEIAKHNINNDIMAFRFNNTELLDNPISLDQIKKIWQERNKRTFFPITPTKIDNQMFFELYRMSQEKK